MSHLVKISTKLHSLSSLKEALKSLGIAHKCAEEGKKLTVKGSYIGEQKVDVAVDGSACGYVEQEDGSYKMVGDTYGGPYNERQLVGDVNMKATFFDVQSQVAALGGSIMDNPTGEVVNGEITLTVGLNY